MCSIPCSRSRASAASRICSMRTARSVDRSERCLRDKRERGTWRVLPSFPFAVQPTHLVSVITGTRNSIGRNRSFKLVEFLVGEFQLEGAQRVGELRTATCTDEWDD